MEGLTAGEEEGRREREGEEKGVTDMVKVSSSLNFFELRLFKDEPPLVSIEKIYRAIYYTILALIFIVENLFPSSIYIHTYLFEYLILKIDRM